MLRNILSETPLESINKFIKDDQALTTARIREVVASDVP
jgi:hypothetical protein